MSTAAIRADGLSKMYRISAGAQGHDTLRDLLADRARGIVARNGPRPHRHELWALRDVSFEIPSGQVVGIIGRNGAGKSTLLKILSRITEPTEGRVEIRGRVGSLLEVGTGFHPELTGRENIYLNGAILGMKKTEIGRKFDEIVGFAEIDRLLDTPVKRYSSGMQVRLAFAVAAHLEPDILLVDEVLAVGDVAFQRKCLGKMSTVAREGRTVLFVSHNMAAVQNLCARGLVVREGHLAFDGSAQEAIADYLRQMGQAAQTRFERNPLRPGDGSFRLTGGWVLDEEGRETGHLVAGRPASFRFAYENAGAVRRPRVILVLWNFHGTAVASFDMDLTGYQVDGIGARGAFACHVPSLPLPLGEYRGGVSVHAGGRLADDVPNAVEFRVESSAFFPTGRTPRLQYATCLIAHEWRHEVDGAP